MSGPEESKRHDAGDAARRSSRRRRTVFCVFMLLLAALLCAGSIGMGTMALAGSASRSVSLLLSADLLLLAALLVCLAFAHVWKDRLALWQDRVGAMLVLGFTLVTGLLIGLKLTTYLGTTVPGDQYDSLTLGGVTIRLPHEPSVLYDWLNGLFFAAIGGAALTTALVLRERRPGSCGKAESRFWMLLACGAFFLAMDELGQIHEFIGYNLGLDDKYIILGYGVFAAGFFATHIRRFLAARAAGFLLLGGALFHSWAVLQQLMGTALQQVWYLEEICELLATGLYFQAIVVLGLTAIIERGASEGMERPSGRE